MGGGLNPNETLSHSNGKFVFDHGPKRTNPGLTDLNHKLEISQKSRYQLYFEARHADNPWHMSMPAINTKTLNRHLMLCLTVHRLDV